MWGLHFTVVYFYVVVADLDLSHWCAQTPEVESICLEKIITTNPFIKTENRLRH